MTAQQERKKHIRAFMQAHYTDERLTQLLAHAQDGKLNYTSCCCFIGIATTDDRLQVDGFRHESQHSFHYLDAQKLAGSKLAEDSFFYLVRTNGETYIDPPGEIRSRILIPMIRAEMKRRENIRRAQVIADAMIEETANV